MYGKTDKPDESSVHEAILEALPAVRRFARSLTGNAADADDLLQSTVERTLARPRPDGLNVTKWMFRICRNLWIDELRGRQLRRARTAQSESPEAQSTGDGDGELIGRITLAEVQRAMEGLPADQRAVLSLVAVEGLSYREAAEVLEIPAGTVMSRLARARAALAERLSGADEITGKKGADETRA